MDVGRDLEANVCQGSDAFFACVVFQLSDPAFTVAAPRNEISVASVE